MYKIVSFEQTCMACPSQWECTLDDGRMIYIRYRWSDLSVKVSDQPTEDIYDAVDGKEIFSSGTSSGFHGVMSLEELQYETRDLLQWP